MRMKILWSLVCLVGLAYAQTARSPVDEVRNRNETPEPLPEGEALMSSVRENLPPMPLRLTGEIRTRSRKEGKTSRGLVSELRFGQQPSWISFSVTDAFGEVLESVRILWDGSTPVWTRDGAPSDPPKNLAGTGLRGSDLALSFLWWPGATVTGIERVRARDAYVVEIPHPEDEGKVRLWIDKRALFVVEAEFLDAEGEALRRLEVDRLKKIREDLWMVQDLVIRDFDARRTINIRFSEVIER